MPKVIKQFREKYHKNHIYNVGDTYPAKGFKADTERVSFLSKKHPGLGDTFLSVEEKAETKSKKKSEK